MTLNTVEIINTMPQTACTPEVPAGTRGTIDLLETPPPGKASVMFWCADLGMDVEDLDDDELTIILFIEYSNLKFLKL